MEKLDLDQWTCPNSHEKKKKKKVWIIGIAIRFNLTCNSLI